jgi:hypothetical protein
MNINNEKIKVFHIEWNYIYNAQFVYNYVQNMQGEKDIICEPECCGKYISLWLAIIKINIQD